MKRNDELKVSILINGINEKTVLGQTVLEQLEQWEDFKLLNQDSVNTKPSKTQFRAEWA